MKLFFIYQAHQSCATNSPILYKYHTYICIPRATIAHTSCNYCAYFSPHIQSILQNNDGFIWMELHKEVIILLPDCLPCKTKRLAMKFDKIFIITIISLLVVSLGQQTMGYGGPPEQSSTGKYTVQITFDKESYNVGDSIMFSGNVNKYDEGRVLQISIFDSNHNLIVIREIPVNADATFSDKIMVNEKFLAGDYTLKAQYGTTKTTIAVMSFVISSDATVIANDESMDQKSPGAIPGWIKNNAGWWANGKIDDNSFVQGMQFLIKQGLMKISN